MYQSQEYNVVVFQLPKARDPYHAKPHLVLSRAAQALVSTTTRPTLSSDWTSYYIHVLYGIYPISFCESQLSRQTGYRQSIAHHQYRRREAPHQSAHRHFVITSQSRTAHDLTIRHNSIPGHSQQWIHERWHCSSPMMARRVMAHRLSHHTWSLAVSIPTQLYLPLPPL